MKLTDSQLQSRQEWPALACDQSVCMCRIVSELDLSVDFMIRTQSNYVY